MRYLVINLHTEERGLFETVHDLGLYMWGRDFTQYAIYVCYHFPWDDGDLGTFRKALAEWA